MLSQFEKSYLHELQKRYNFEYLRPPKQIYNIQIPESEYFSYENVKEPKRKIYFNVKYTEEENKIIRQIKELMLQTDIDEKFKDQLILKHAYMSKFDKQKVVQRLKIVFDHHQDPIINRFDDNTINRLKEGVVYTYGYDKSFRPVVIVRNYKVNYQSLELLWNTYFYIMLMVFHYRMVPYYAQKITFIADFGRAPMTSLPVFKIYQEMKTIGLCYTGIMERAIIYNSQSLGLIWKIGYSFLTDFQKKKTIQIKRGQEYKALQYIDADQLQQKYGGTSPNLQQFWPPLTPKQIHQKSIIKDIESSQYYSVDNDIEYFQLSENKQSRVGCCNSCQCDIY